MERLTAEEIQQVRFAMEIGDLPENGGSNRVWKLLPRLLDEVDEGRRLRAAVLDASWVTPDRDAPAMCWCEEDPPSDGIHQIECQQIRAVFGLPAYEPPPQRRSS